MPTAPLWAKLTHRPSNGEEEWDRGKRGVGWQGGCKLRLLRLALVLSADAGGARFVDIGASLEGVASVDTRVVGEPLAALHFLAICEAIIRGWRRSKVYKDSLASPGDRA